MTLPVVEAFRDVDLRALAARDGLPGSLDLAALRGAIDVHDDVRGEGVLGTAPVAWLAADSGRYEGGVRVWVEAGRVVLLEGDDPVDDSGAPSLLPDLGVPEAVHDTVLGRLVLAGGEQVHAARGLAVRLNPDNGVVLGVLLFARTTPEDYAARLRPRREPRRLLSGATRPASAVTTYGDQEGVAAAYALVLTASRGEGRATGDLRLPGRREADDVRCR